MGWEEATTNQALSKETSRGKNLATADPAKNVAEEPSNANQGNAKRSDWVASVVGIRNGNDPLAA